MSASFPYWERLEQKLSGTVLTERLAQYLGAQAVFLPVPGVVSNSSIHDSLMGDTHVREVVSTFSDLSAVLLGIGSLNPSRMIRESGNVISDHDFQALREAGAVGDICQRFFDDQGRYIDTVMHDRVLGISPEQLLKVPRRIGVAGGSSKFEAIRAAARGGGSTR